jgi:hypothetical protein
MFMARAIEERANAMKDLGHHRLILENFLLRSQAPVWKRGQDVWL